MDHRKSIFKIWLLTVAIVNLFVLGIGFYQYIEIKSLRHLELSAESATINQNTPTLIYNGGHNSCIRAPLAKNFHRGLWPEHYSELAETVRFAKQLHRQPPRLIFTCIYLSPNDLYVIDSSQDGHSGYQRMSLASFLNLSQSFAKQGPTFYMGHSYGAWIAIQAALRHQGNQYALLTMDPISPLGCNYLESTLEFLRTGTSVGCRTAPKDVTQRQLTRLSQGTLFWLNAYQDSFPFIHSSPFPAANNMHVPIKGSSTSFFAIADPLNAHNKLRAVSSIWQSFRRSLATLAL